MKQDVCVLLLGFCGAVKGSWALVSRVPAVRERSGLDYFNASV
jgi:hypothetical protein